MEELIQALRVLLSDTVVLSYKAKGYHWNVEGVDFNQYHEFFEDIYTDYDGSIDTFAEWIRKLGDYAPYKLSRFQAFSDIPETDVHLIQLQCQQTFLWLMIWLLQSL